MRFVYPLVVLTLMLFSIAAGFFIGKEVRDNKDDGASAELARQAELSLNQVNVRCDKQHQRLLAVEHELSRISEIDVTEYLRLKDADVKLAKLSEIMGKLFIVFLNYSLVSLPTEQVEFAKAQSGEKLLNTTTDGPATPSTPIGEDKGSADGSDADHQIHTSPEVPAAKSNGRAGWADAERAGSNPTMSNAKDFLEHTAIPDLRAALRDGPPFQEGDSRLAHILGAFSGQVSFFDAKRPKTRIELEVGPVEVSGSQVRGHLTLRTFKDGVQAGTSNSNGNLDDLMTSGSPSTALFLKWGEGKFFQLYYVDQQDGFVGNIYEMTATSDSKRIGTITLTH